MLFTKCILHLPSDDDGLRISVMSRLTLNDGKTPDGRIQAYHMHIPELGPSPKLIGRYYREEIDWDLFQQEYLKEITTLKKRALVRFVASQAMKINVTIMCVEETPEFCHRRLLAEECQKHQPSLCVEHR
jgi:uncharacterized protein YeaO (DUF488 family)